jgi:large conductance mechanosensitive channel
MPHHWADGGRRAPHFRSAVPARPVRHDRAAATSGGKAADVDNFCRNDPVSPCLRLGESDKGADLMSGFRKFLMRGNLIDLAVAVVIGVAFNAIVQAMIADIITPLIAALFKQPNFGKLTFTINHSEFRYGLFINSVVSFVVIAAVVYYLIVAPMAKIISITDRNKEATERPCPECLSDIPMEARRCKFCTAEVPPVVPSRHGAHGAH